MNKMNPKTSLSPKKVSPSLKHVYIKMNPITSLNPKKYPYNISKP